MESLVYVSRNAIGADRAVEEVGHIVAAAQLANQRRDLTGGLIFTGRHFAQVLEGPPARIDALLSSLRADPRHVDLRVIGRHTIDRRYFFDWSLAYSGAPNWVDQHIETIFAGDIMARVHEEEAMVARLVLQFALVRRCAA